MTDFVVSLPIARYLMRQPMGDEQAVDVVPGLRHEMVQSFDMVVSHAAMANLHTIVMARLPALSTHDQAVIAQALAATRRPELAFLSECSPGSGSAECSESADAKATAAAVAVVCASASPAADLPLAISINGQLWQVNARWDGRNWQCQVG